MIQGVHFDPATNATVVTFGGKPLRVFSIRQEWIEALMPRDAQLGKAEIVVSVRGQSSKPFLTGVVPSNPGIFSTNEHGWGPGKIDNLDRANKRTGNSIANPATPGAAAILTATGIGGLNETVVFVGGRRTRAAAREIPGTGIEELTFRIPKNAPLGCYVPVYLQNAPDRASNVVTMAIGSGGCGPIPMLSENRLGVALFSRTNFRARGATLDSIEDDATVIFAAGNKAPVLSPLLLLPPEGTCTSYTSSFQADTVLPNTVSAALLSELQGHGIDAGAHITLSRGSESRRLYSNRSATGFYRMHIGHGGFPPRRYYPLFLDPGTFAIDGEGGKDVGPFHAMAAGPPLLEWTNRDATAVVDRTKPLLIKWRASADGVVIVLVTNVDQITTAIGTSLCAARASDGSLTMPAMMLANVPASYDMPGIPYDQLFTTLIPAKASASMAAPGLDGGVILSIYAAGRYVQIR
jgi:uncharacterized protein (TIGR03437 family)